MPRAGGAVKSRQILRWQSPAPAIKSAGMNEANHPRTTSAGPDGHIDKQELIELAARVVEMAKAAGAVHADALAVADAGASIAVRNGEVESVAHENARGIGLRVFVERQGGLAFATASGSDVSGQALRALVEQTLAMARIYEPDPDAVPPEGAAHPDAAAIAAWEQRHDRADPGWDIAQAREAALACEAAALDTARITNSEGAEAAFGAHALGLAASDGFAAGYRRATASLSVSVIAGEGEAMQRDYAWDQAHDAARLKAPASIGEEAARRAVRRLGASGMESATLPVVFEPRVAIGLLGHLAGAVNGRAVLQQRSFLADAMGRRILPAGVDIVDDPDHPDGLGNRLFDGEGSRCARLAIVRDGVLESWMTNRYTARRLNAPATGHASRGLTGDIGIAPSNLILKPGAPTADELIADIPRGLLVTELIGFGVNPVTGDYSRGAAGFLIENGRIGRPVQGITIAGNLKDMFAQLAPASDLTWFGRKAAPSVRIAHMTIAGD